MISEDGVPKSTSETGHEEDASRHSCALWCFCSFWGLAGLFMLLRSFCFIVFAYFLWFKFRKDPENWCRSKTAVNLRCFGFGSYLHAGSMEPHLVQGEPLASEHCAKCLGFWPSKPLGHNWPSHHMWMFPKIGVPQNGWFIMENPIKMDDLGVPLFWTHPCQEHAHPAASTPLQSWGKGAVLCRLFECVNKCRFRHS